MNTWINAYKNEINNLIYKMDEYHLRGSYGGNLNFPDIIKIIKGSCSEINRLQKELDDVKKENDNIVDAAIRG